MLPMTNIQLGIGNIAIGNTSTSATFNNRIAEMRDMATKSLPLRSCRRTVNRATMSADGNCYWKLAPRRKIAEVKTWKCESVEI